MSETLENLLQETRQFPPPAELAAAANVTADAYDEAAADRLAFWEKQARRLNWAKPWDQVLDWSNPPFAKWFVGGELNIAYNCLDRHVEAGRGDKVAIHWEGEPGDTRTLTYADLHTADLPGGQRADRARRRRRRPGRDLPADDPRGGGRDAGLRPDRRDAQRGLRRLLRRRAVRPDPGRQRQGGDHRRRRLPARQAVARSSRPSTRRSPQCPTHRARAGGPAHRPGRGLGRQGRVVARDGRDGQRRAHGRSRSTPSTRCSSSTPSRHDRASRRASCTPPAAT